MSERISLSSLASPQRTHLPPLMASTSTPSISSDTNLNLQAAKSNDVIKSHAPIITPQSEASEMFPLRQTVSSLIFEISARIHFDEEPKLCTLSPDAYPEEFINKCTQCCQICGFGENHEVERKQKENIIRDLIQSFSDTRLISSIGETEYVTFYNFFEKNIVRTLPDAPPLWFAPISIDFHLDRVEEEGWSHMELAYQAFIAFLETPHYNHHFPKVNFQLIQFLPKLFKLFSSPDVREREMVTKVLYSIYKKHQKLRTQIKTFANKLFVFIMNTERPKLGCAELLSFFIPVIQGYKTPLHAENITFFNDFLVPLHSFPNFHLFYDELVGTMRSFLLKDTSLIPPLIKYLLEKWPQTNPTKEIMFLNEIELIFQFLPQSSSIRGELIYSISKRIGQCIQSPHFGVTERALMLWESDSFIAICGLYTRIIFVILIPALFKTATTHWCADVRTLAVHALQVLKGINEEFFDSTGSSLKKIESQTILRELESGTSWSSLALTYLEPEEALKIQLQIQPEFIGCESLVRSQSSSCKNGNATEVTSKSTNQVQDMNDNDVKYGKKRRTSSSVIGTMSQEVNNPAGPSYLPKTNPLPKKLMQKGSKKELGSTPMSATVKKSPFNLQSPVVSPKIEAKIIPRALGKH